jgi:hypothetical protein
MNESFRVRCPATIVILATHSGWPVTCLPECTKPPSTRDSAGAARDFQTGPRVRRPRKFLVAVDERATRRWAGENDRLEFGQEASPSHERPARGSRGHNPVGGCRLPQEARRRFSAGRPIPERAKEVLAVLPGPSPAAPAGWRAGLKSVRKQPYDPPVAARRRRAPGRDSRVESASN